MSAHYFNPQEIFSGKSICLLPGDKMQSPPVPPHQIVDDNFIAKFTGAIGLGQLVL